MHQRRRAGKRVRPTPVVGAGLGRDDDVGRRHRRHNGRPRTIGQLCCSIARKGVPLSDPVLLAQQETTGAHRSIPSALLSSAIVAGITTNAIERPFAPWGDWARGKNLAHQPSAGLTNSIKTINSPNQITPTHNTYIPVVAGIVAAAKFKSLKILVDSAATHAYGSCLR
jgi:hypothetical protein